MGVTATDTRVGEVTASPTEPLIDPAVAEMVVFPAATAVVTPLLSLLATDGELELQITELVRS